MAPSTCRQALLLVAATTLALPTSAQTIIDIAVATPELSTLVVAVTTAGLDDTLSGDGPFTVFAPTNDAFAALPNGTVEALLDDVPTLTDILLYHVVSGTVLSTDLTDGMMPETLQGSTVTVSIGASVMINEATVVMADVIASNGVVHVIDAVLLPPPDDDEPADDSSSSSQTSKKNDGLIAGMTILLILGVCGCLGVALYLIKLEHEEEHEEPPEKAESD